MKSITSKRWCLAYIILSVVHFLYEIVVLWLHKAFSLELIPFSHKQSICIDIYPNGRLAYILVLLKLLLTHTSISPYNYPELERERTIIIYEIRMERLAYISQKSVLNWSLIQGYRKWTTLIISYILRCSWYSTYKSILMKNVDYR